MAGFDYGNARLRAMKSRLLSMREIQEMAAAGSIEGLIGMLTKTSYREAVNLALARFSGKDCIGEALRQDTADNLGKIRGFYTESAGDIVSLVLRAYDVKNIKAILRGLEKNITPVEILLGVIPVGELSRSILSELASAPDPRAGIDMMASMGLSIVQPLLKFRTEFPGAALPDMELALDRWHFADVFHYMQENRAAKQTLFPAMQIEADVLNLQTVLRFAHTPDEHHFRRKLLLSEELGYLLIGPGKLPISVLELAAVQETVPAAVQVFTGTSYEKPLAAGLEAYARSARLSDFEKHLMRFRLKWMSAQISSDPLGIGVVLGYLALKTNEINNLRWILEGISMGLNPAAIKAAVEVLL